jgi:hypothetical protein
MSRLVRQTLQVGAFLWLASIGDHASAQDLTSALLRQICDTKDIRGNECAKARDYPDGKECNVKLGDDRHVGKFIASQTVLIVHYESDCEAHANNFGGSIVFEQAGESYTFNSYQPGQVFTECASLARSAQQDRLVCLTGHMGQGFLESTISEVVFTRDFSKSISASLDVLVTATDSVGAYGVNRVECKETRVLFGFSKLERGSVPDTVLVTVEYADRAVITQSCRRGAPRPKGVTKGVRFDRGEAFVDPKAVKTGRFSLDLGKRQLKPN